MQLWPAGPFFLIVAVPSKHNRVVYEPPFLVRVQKAKRDHQFLNGG